MVLALLPPGSLPIVPQSELLGCETVARLLSAACVDAGRAASDVRGHLQPSCSPGVIDRMHQRV